MLATRILKQTGSYEQASYAIQDTAATVACHYGRFPPQDKAALAAEYSTRFGSRGWMNPSVWLLSPEDQADAILTGKVNGGALAKLRQICPDR